VDELTLTPLELIDRIAALVPPPRTHRHRYYGVLAPNSPLRAAVTALAAPVQAATAQAQTATMSEGLPGLVPAGNATPPTPEPVQPKRSPAHYLWAVLIARIYEVFPLVCPICAGQMRIFAFITHSADIHRILVSLGVESEPLRIAPARGPPLWEDCDAQLGEGTQIEPDWDLSAQSAPGYEVDQRVNWRVLEAAVFYALRGTLASATAKKPADTYRLHQRGLGLLKPLKSRALGCPKPVPYLVTCG
jgi:Putative transposase